MNYWRFQSLVMLWAIMDLVLQASPSMASPAQPGTINSARLETKAEISALPFSDPPTTTELFRARVFGEPLVPIGGKFS